MEIAAHAQLFGPIEVESFAAPANFHVPRHGHEGIHFTLLSMGGFEELRGQRRRIGAGDIRVSPLDDEHELRFGPLGASCLIVSVDRRWFRAATGVEGPRERRNAAHPLTHRWSATLGAALAERGPETGLIVEGLALELAAWAGRPSREPFDALPAWLLRLRDELHDAPLEVRSLGDIGRRSGRHPVYVARAFRRHFGRSIGEYARDLRVAHAARLLARTGDPLVEIADSCGFSDQAHFTRWVRRTLGVTPGQLRASRQTR